MTRKKICFVVAVPGTATSFLADHINALRQHYDVYLAGNISNEQQLEGLNLNGWKHIDIERQIHLRKDIKAVMQLKRYFSEMKFDAVHSVTPKAGLTCALSAWFARIKHRTHIFTGQVWATKTGPMRWLLKTMDRVIALLDNHILVDGEPQRQYLIQNHVISSTQSRVLGVGSISGVNTVRFTPSETIRDNIRQELHIPEDKIVYCFMGRQNREKGIYELYAAFDKLASEYSNVMLLMYGSDEEGCLERLPQYSHIKPNENFIFYGRTNTPGHHLQGADIFCMPSYREGFGSSVIEASCLGLPVICSDVYGMQDTMLDDITGLRCKVKSVDSLYNAMVTYIKHPELRKLHGDAGRNRVLQYFAGEVITQHWVDWYQNILTNV